MILCQWNWFWFIVQDLSFTMLLLSHCKSASKFECYSTPCYFSPPILMTAPRLSECMGTDGDRRPDSAVTWEADGWQSRGWKQEVHLEKIKCMTLRSWRGEESERSLSSPEKWLIHEPTHTQSKSACSSQLNTVQDCAKVLTHPLFSFVSKEPEFLVILKLALSKSSEAFWSGFGHFIHSFQSL